MKKIMILLGVLSLVMSCTGGGLSPSAAKELTAFAIVTPAVTGTTDETAHTVAVSVAFGTDVTALVATFTTTGATVKVGTTAQVSGITANDFTNPVTYTVVAADISTQDYVVTVTVGSSSSKALTSFGFATPAATGTIDETAHTVAATVPTGTDVTTLVATFTTIGSSVRVGTTVQVSGTTANNFTNPVTYTVVAADTSTQDYVVTLTLSPSPAKALTAFGFVTPAVSGTIDETAHTVAATVPFGTDVTALVVTFTTTGSSVRVGATTQVSGTTANNFTNAVTYTVVAADGSTQDYTVSVTTAVARTISGIVTHLAGTVLVAGSVDGNGSSAQFNMPVGMAFTGTHLYVADANNHTIRKVDVLTGAVSTLAGTAAASGSDDGTGPAARFNTPHGIAIVGACLYVADTYNHTVRKVDTSTGAVSTLAGTALGAGSADGSGSSAQFNTPAGLASDGSYLYVADTANHTIRKVDVLTRAVSTLAGTAGASGSDDGTGPAARFNTPIGIASDGIYLYIADTFNSLIRKIDASTGVATTLAGSAGAHGSADGAGPTARFDHPYGIASDGSNLYVVDTWSSAIRQVDPSTGLTITLAGRAGTAGSADGTGADALFNSPCGIALDGSYLYVADTHNQVIRRIE